MNLKQTNILFPSIKLSGKPSEIKTATEYSLYFDGCSKGNPGQAGIGAVIYKNSEEIWASCVYLGEDKTNNEAEYSALLLGLNQALKSNVNNLSVYGDSLLVINQMKGIYKVKNENLFELFSAASILKKKFSYIDFNHVYRKDNKRADELSNLALMSVDKHVSWDNKLTY